VNKVKGEPIAKHTKVKIIKKNKGSASAQGLCWALTLPNML